MRRLRARRSGDSRFRAAPLLALALALLFSLSGCTTLNQSLAAIAPPSPTSQPSAIPTPGQIQASRAAIVGQIFSKSGGKRAPMINQVLTLGRVHWYPDRSDGAFVFEGATSPRATTGEDGGFVFQNIEPADYVLMVGDPLGPYEIIAETDGKAKVYKVEVGKALNAGSLDVNLVQH